MGDTDLLQKAPDNLASSLAENRMIYEAWARAHPAFDGADDSTFHDSHGPAVAAVTEFMANCEGYTTYDWMVGKRNPLMIAAESLP